MLKKSNWIIAIVLIVAMSTVLIGCSQGNSESGSFDPANFSDEYGSTLDQDGFLRDSNGDVVGEYDFDTNTAKYFTETWNPSTDNYDGKYQIEENEKKSPSPSNAGGRSSDNNSEIEYEQGHQAGYSKARAGGTNPFDYGSGKSESYKKGFSDGYSKGFSEFAIDNATSVNGQHDDPSNPYD